METNYDNALFVRWLNDELSPEELSEFEKSPKFSLYKKIAEKSGELDTVGFNESNILTGIKTRIKEQPITPKVRTLFPRIIYAAVASVTILIGLFFFLNSSTAYTTSYGEQLAITLPDNSEVILNAKSKISLKKRNWAEDKTLKLTGEAFFKVTKGNLFSVETTLGKITVLGTQFNVDTKGKIIEVKCFEGKVKVETSEHTHILTHGRAFRQLNDTTVETFDIVQLNPSWINGESTFDNAPLHQVIATIENQYNISIDASKIDVTQRFTGSFTHNDLNVALQTVFVPLKIVIKFTTAKSVLLVKQ